MKIHRFVEHVFTNYKRVLIYWYNLAEQVLKEIRQLFFPSFV